MTSSKQQSCWKPQKSGLFDAIHATELCYEVITHQSCQNNQKTRPTAAIQATELCYDVISKPLSFAMMSLCHKALKNTKNSAYCCNSSHWALLWCHYATSCQKYKKLGLLLSKIHIKTPPAHPYHPIHHYKMAGLNDNFTFFMCTPYPTIILPEFALTAEEKYNIPEDLYSIFSQAKIESIMLGKRYKLLIDFINSMPFLCH